jgi:hypothetical protein
VPTAWCPCATDRQGRATRSGAPDHAPPAKLGKGRDTEAPSTPSNADDQPRRRSAVAPTQSAAWPHRSAPARRMKAPAESGAVDSNRQPGRRASIAAARSPAATASTTDAPSQRHPKPGRSLPQRRAPQNSLHQRPPTSKSELRTTGPQGGRPLLDIELVPGRVPLPDRDRAVGLDESKKWFTWSRAARFARSRPAVEEHRRSPRAPACLSPTRDRVKREAD